MMTHAEELTRLRAEARDLRKRNATVERAHAAQQTRADTFEKKVITASKKIKILEEKVAELETENADLKSRLGLEIDKAKTYAGMIFKANTKKSSIESTNQRGAQSGHPAHVRPQPERIDSEVSVHLSNCYDCGTKLSQTTSVDERIVTDIPQTTTVTTKYSIQRQWCTTCHKEVRGIPQGTLPRSSFGIGILTRILFYKYRLRTPLARIVEALESQYGLSMSEGGIQSLLRTTKTTFTKQYNTILEEIRNAPVKHADETSWRIEGANGWCWLFATPTAALYTIEETRGKEVPGRIFGRDPTGVLVRDDYCGYKKLPMVQQSCWAHLLRVSHDAVEREGASRAVEALHTELKILFDEIDAIAQTPFKPRVRKQQYVRYLSRVDAIINRRYTDTDAKAIQTRIKNQQGNLLTTILYDTVPLTNNFAERMIRPMVITRKISGGSQSADGAATHSVNMSIVQTLTLKGQSFFEGIRHLLQANNPRYALGEGE